MGSIGRMLTVATITTIIMLLASNVIMAYDKESTWDYDYGQMGGYSAVRVGGETPDKKYFSSCWIHYKSSGNTWIYVDWTMAKLYGFRDLANPDYQRYLIGEWKHYGAVDIVRSRVPQSSITYAIQGICDACLRHSWLPWYWETHAVSSCEAKDPPIVTAMVFFNTTE